MQHQSASQYFGDLSVLNPMFTDFKQIHREMCSAELAEALGITTEYDRNHSLLFRGHSYQKLKCESNGDLVFVTHEIVFAVGRGSDSMPIAPSGQHYSAIFNQCRFHKEFFVRSPGDLTVITCNGHRCQRSFVPSKSEFWCESCQGDFYYAYRLIHLMHTSLNFSQMPKDAILYVKETAEPLKEDDLDSLCDALELLEEDKKKIDVLQTAGTRERIEQAQQILAAYGGIMGLNGHIEVLKKKIQVLEGENDDE